MYRIPRANRRCQKKEAENNRDIAQIDAEAWWNRRWTTHETVRIPGTARWPEATHGENKISPYQFGRIEAGEACSRWRLRGQSPVPEGQRVPVARGKDAHSSLTFLSSSPSGRSRSLRPALGCVPEGPAPHGNASCFPKNSRIPLSAGAALPREQQEQLNRTTNATYALAPRPRAPPFTWQEPNSSTLSERL